MKVCRYITFIDEIKVNTKRTDVRALFCEILLFLVKNALRIEFIKPRNIIFWNKELPPVQCGMRPYAFRTMGVKKFA
jgi:hypothetical protein